MKTTNTPKERPILFSGPMVRAILDGRKTQTRRIVKPQPKPFGKSSYGGTRQGWAWKPETFNRAWNDDDKNPYRTDPNKMATCALRLQCPYGQPGDRLWVKETFLIDDCRFYPSGRLPKEKPDITEHQILYRANGTCCEQLGECDCEGRGATWRPSIFMPRWASRITLEITAVRVERLQDITEQDAIAEGLEILPGYDKPTYQLYGKGNEDNCSSNARKAYSFLWESINGKGSWAANPWVWVVEFRKI